MVKSILTSELIRAGEQLVERLDRGGARADAAFWLYDPEPDTWRLVFVRPGVSEEGPRKAYEAIHRVMASSSEPSPITLRDITVKAPDARIVQLVRASLENHPGASGVRLTNHGVNGTLIEDAYVYRVT